MRELLEYGTSIRFTLQVLDNATNTYATFRPLFCQLKQLCILICSLLNDFDKCITQPGMLDFARLRFSLLQRHVNVRNDK